MLYLQSGPHLSTLPHTLPHDRLSQHTARGALLGSYASRSLATTLWCLTTATTTQVRTREFPAPLSTNPHPSRPSASPNDTCCCCLCWPPFLFLLRRGSRFRYLMSIRTRGLSSRPLIGIESYFFRQVRCHVSQSYVRLHPWPPYATVSLCGDNSHHRTCL